MSGEDKNLPIEKQMEDNEEEEGNIDSILPEGWTAKESKSRPGLLYYINLKTNETQWDVPKDPAKNSAKKQARRPHPYEKPATKDEIRVCHILIKHEESRNPYSWRNKSVKITKSKAEAIEQLKLIREDLLKNTNNGEDHKKLIKDFKDVAYALSDCSSASSMGEMKPFGKGAMMKPFEDASFALGINQVSEIISTDSGAHIILRLE